MPDSVSHSPTPVSLANDGEALVIVWSDGVRHRIAWRTLRERCPCATCRIERDNPQPQNPLAILSPQEARPLSPAGMHPVGNYAYNIRFSDGHHTGIYTLELLRSLGEPAEE